MGIRDRLKQKRQEAVRDLKKFQKDRDKVIDGRLGQLEVISKNLNKRQKRDITINPNLQLGTNTPYQVVGCPYFSNNNAHDEPFGWKKGTVRGMITIWTTLAFLFGFLLGYIPIVIAAPVFTAIIMGYFVGRARTF